MPQIIGEDLLARDEQGKLRTRIATVFPRHNAIVTLPGIHATQRADFVDYLNAQRTRSGLGQLSEQEEMDLWLTAVDLILENDTILIRPDPSDMEIAFEADEVLQQCASKKQIKFMYLLYPQVRDAIKERGECWRISQLPRSPSEMLKMIEAAKIGIAGKEIYYYNKATGTRLLTCFEFSALPGLDEVAFRQHMLEIREYSGRRNRMGNSEVAFFKAPGNELAAMFQQYDFAAMSHPELLEAAEAIRRKFRSLAPVEFWKDDPQNCQWRSAMYATLIGQNDTAVSEEQLLGLSAEFFMQVEWVPGGRVHDGELFLDPVFDEEDTETCCPITPTVCDMRARSFIINFVRDYGDLEHINIGRVAASLSQRGAYAGRRGVYLAEIKQRGNPNLILRIIRMQKYGVWEHLDEGKDLLQSMLDSDEYTDYILDRRLGCRQLGMNLPARITARRIEERYTGYSTNYQNTLIRSPYFERDYVPGLATDKIPSARFGEDSFALTFARLLGRAAAPNLILGRCDVRGTVVFDDGDELLIQDQAGTPIDIVVTDHTGTFQDYQRPLRELAPAYALSVVKRAEQLSNPSSFLDTFVEALVMRFTLIQREYRRRHRAFDSLFQHARRDERGSYRYRWEQVLERLDATPPGELADPIRRAFAEKMSAAAMAHP